MALSNATLIDGATLSATGGTTVNYAPSGKIVPDGVEIVDVDATDYQTRTSVSLRVKMPSYNANTATWSKGKRMVTFVAPKVLASGEVVFPVVRIDVEDHPEMTAAEALELRTRAAQILFDADFDTYFKTGSKA